MTDPTSNPDITAMNARHGTGWIPSPPEVPAHNHALLAHLQTLHTELLAAGLPAEFDPRDSWIEIWNQGNYNSCVAFGIAAIIYRAVRKHEAGTIFSASRLYIYFVEREATAMGQYARIDSPGHEWWQDVGGSTVWALKALEHSGFVREDEYNYSLCGQMFDPQGKHAMPPEDIIVKAARHHFFSWTRIDDWNGQKRPTKDQLKTILAQDKPILFATIMWPNMYNMYAVDKATVSYGPADIYRDRNGVPDGHVMTIVGYKMQNGTDCAIVRNSWSTSWGDKGYCYWPWDLMIDGKVNGNINNSPFRCNEWFVVDVGKKGLDGPQ